jgi:tetratricopeptide (TPR) repeat protein
MLAHVSYVQAACWITACLADALQYAHDRGLVHLDVKPSNVLLANDGQPMLLDFHLAREPIQCGGPLPDRFGGTLAYMPPEQRAAMLALQSGRPVEQPVDARADIYALGAILYELLGGTLPLEAQPRPLFQINPQVSVGLSDIVARCLAPQPDDRYSSAAALADDLRRHLTDQPLAGVANRSPAERWHKWRRRRPNAVRAAGMLAVVGGVAALAVAGVWSRTVERCGAAEQALRDGQAQLETGQPAEAVATFERGLAGVENLPFRRDLAEQLRDQLATARRLRAAGQLHQLANQIRALYGTGPRPPDRLRALAQLCGEFWQKREQIAATLDAGRDPEVATDLLDLAIFWADLQVRLAPESEANVARTPRMPSAAARELCLQQAICTLDEAETMFGASRVLEYQRRVYASAIEGANVPASGDREERRSPDQPAHASRSADRRSAWEHTALGRALLDSGSLSQAAEELEAARAIDSSGPWTNFYYGLCAYRLGRHEDAVAAFSVSIGAAPEVAGCFYNRALAYAALGRTDRALHDYDRALELDPTLAAAWLNRGMLHYKLEQHDEAVADLCQALQHGADAATVHYDMALIHLATNDTAAAIAEANLALEHDPSHEPARRLRDSLRRADAASAH